MVYKEISLIILLCFCIVLLPVACQTQSTISVINESSYTIEDALIEFDRSIIRDFNLAERGCFLLNGVDTLPLQIILEENPDKGGALITQVSLNAKEELILTVNFCKTGDCPTYKATANAYLGVSPQRNNQFESATESIRPQDHIAQSTPFLYQFEGPAWESDRVGFRSYFDNRNGKDIFGKTKPQLYVDKIGLGEDYHKLQDWGMDILKVGTSLGAGALGLLKNDSIYRLEITEESKFKIIEDGPLRAAIQLTYDGWKVDSSIYQVEENISIIGGQSWYKSMVNFKESTSDTIITGIVNLYDMEVNSLEKDGYNIVFTHGIQSENKDHLGMALIIPTRNYAGLRTAPKSGKGITNTYVVLLNPVDSHYTYYFYTGWEGSDQRFAGKEFFQNELLRTVDKLNARITVEKN